jgi:hypothetical protein
MPTENSAELRDGRRLADLLEALVGQAREVVERAKGVQASRGRGLSKASRERLADLRGELSATLLDLDAILAVGPTPDQERLRSEWSELKEDAGASRGQLSTGQGRCR